LLKTSWNSAVYFPGVLRIFKMKTNEELSGIGDEKIKKY
jgi:hypothetical protein